MRASLVNRVAAYLGCPEAEVASAAQQAPRTYRHYRIPKKKGGHRTIHHPSRQTKALQYAIMELLLGRLPVHSSAFAYRPNISSPLANNARMHANFRYSVRIDFADFFHSIRPHDLLSVMESQGIPLSEADARFLENCLFIRIDGTRKGLAIGAPSSPAVSNIVMYAIDDALRRLANNTSDPAAYTRYADDVFFSTNVRGACVRFCDGVQEIVEETVSPGIRINPAKTVFSSRGTRRVVTGIFVRPDGGISLGRRNKRYVRKLVFELEKGTLSPRESSYLRGYLAFVLDVEPDFYNRLTVKYGAHVLAKALNPG